MLFSIPNVVENFDLLKDYGLNPLIENLPRILDLKELRETIREHDIGLVLDIHHIMKQDPSMTLCYKILEIFGDKIVEIHVSGYDGDIPPIYQSKSRI